MSENISDRNEYTNLRYAKMRTAQIEAILENEDLTPEEIADYESELKALAPWLTEATSDTAKFRFVSEQQFKPQLQVESTRHPNPPVYGLTRGHSYAITMDYATVNYLTGCGYNLVYEMEYHPKRQHINPDVPTSDTLIAATKSLLESFIDNYTTDGLNRGMNMDMIRTEIAQSLSGVFKPGNLRYLGFDQYELDGQIPVSAPTTKKMVIFNDDEGVIDMVLDVKNWDENFNKAVNAGAHAWRNSTDEYCLVITEHLTAAGYQFDVLDPEKYDILTDYT